MPFFRSGVRFAHDYVQYVEMTLLMALHGNKHLLARSYVLCLPLRLSLIFREINFQACKKLSGF